MKVYSVGNVYPGRLESLQEALDAGESDMWSRDDVFRMVQDFLSVSENLGFDALMHLRTVFPLYDWECYEIIESHQTGQELEVRDSFLRLMEMADFFWPIGGTADDWVIARRKDRVGKGLALCGSKQVLDDLQRDAPDSITAWFLRALGDPAIIFKNQLEVPDL